jgi:hypothetical protein
MHTQIDGESSAGPLPSQGRRDGDELPGIAQAAAPNQTAPILPLWRRWQALNSFQGLTEGAPVQCKAASARAPSTEDELQPTT